MLQEVELWGLKNALVVCSLPLYPLLRRRRAKYVFVIRERALFIRTLFISIEDVEKRSTDGNQDGRISNGLLREASRRLNLRRAIFLPAEDA